MRTLAALIALPFALLGMAIHLFLLPALVLATVWLIFGTGSAVFTWTFLLCLPWVYIEYRQLQKAGSGGRRTRR